MSRSSKDTNFGCLLTLIFLPIVLFIAIIKDLVVLCTKNTNNKTHTTKLKQNNKQKTHSKEEIDDLEFDEINDIWD